jgi:hypothetical protein
LGPPAPSGGAPGRSRLTTGAGSDRRGSSGGGAPKRLRHRVTPAPSASSQARPRRWDVRPARGSRKGSGFPRGTSPDRSMVRPAGARLARTRAHPPSAPQVRGYPSLTPTPNNCISARSTPPKPPPRGRQIVRDCRRADRSTVNARSSLRRLLAHRIAALEGLGTAFPGTDRYPTLEFRNERYLKTAGEDPAVQGSIAALERSRRAPFQVPIAAQLLSHVPRSIWEVRSGRPFRGGSSTAFGADEIGAQDRRVGYVDVARTPRPGRG